MKKLILIIFIYTSLINLSLADSYSGTSYNWSTGEYNNIDVSLMDQSLKCTIMILEIMKHDATNKIKDLLKLIIGKLVKITIE